MLEYRVSLPVRDFFLRVSQTVRHSGYYGRTASQKSALALPEQKTYNERVLKYKHGQQRPFAFDEERIR